MHQGQFFVIFVIYFNSSFQYLISPNDVAVMTLEACGCSFVKGRRVKSRKRDVFLTMSASARSVVALVASVTVVVGDATFEALRDFGVARLD